jgi:hypothetical protein
LSITPFGAFFPAKRAPRLNLTSAPCIPSGVRTSQSFRHAWMIRCNCGRIGRRIDLVSVEKVQVSRAFSSKKKPEKKKKRTKQTCQKKKKKKKNQKPKNQNQERKIEKRRHSAAHDITHDQSRE